MNQFPEEIIFIIVSFLKYHKCLLRVVCKRFNKLFSDKLTYGDYNVWYMYLKKDVVKEIYGKNNRNLFFLKYI